jgi:hypothetical protein
MTESAKVACPECGNDLFRFLDCPEEGRECMNCDMSQHTTLYVLGASDPEMALIEDVLTRAESLWTRAVLASGKAVSPASAYGFPYGGEPLTDAIVFVECAPDEESKARLQEAGVTIRTIDHHRPGDPGYGKPPAEYLWASSIGQVVRSLTHHQRILLGARPQSLQSVEDADIAVHIPCDDHVDSFPFALSREIRYAAAADHCLAAAYAGYCPGVHPDALMRWRVNSRAGFQGRSAQEIMHDVEDAIRELQEAVRSGRAVTVAGVTVADMRNRTFPELPEAAARLGQPFLARVQERDGVWKTVLQVAPPEVIRAWMREHPGSYGDPARGFAGITDEHD